MRTLESSRPALAAVGASLGRSFHAFVFVAYPLLFVVGTTAPALPVDRAAIARCLAIAVAVTAASLFALKSVISDLSVRAACVSSASILSFGFFLMFGGALDTCGSRCAVYLCQYRDHFAGRAPLAKEAAQVDGVEPCCLRAARVQRFGISRCDRRRTAMEACG